MADEIEDQKTAGGSFKYVHLDFLVSICERISTSILILICPKFVAVGTFIMLGTMVRLQYLVCYRLGVLIPEMYDLYFTFFGDRMISAFPMFFWWPSYWYRVVIVVFWIISTTGTSCNIYSIYTIIRKEKAEIEKKRLLAIEAIKEGAANSAKLFDFVIYHSDYYRNYLQYYGGETAYRLSYTRIREELDLPGDRLV